MPDTRKQSFENFWTDITGTKHTARCQNFSYSRAGFRRWCFFCASLTPATFGAKASAVRCEACTKRLRGFEDFILAQVPMDSCAATTTTAVAHHRGVTIGELLYEQSI
jgi:hypothetical protein